MSACPQNTRPATGSTGRAMVPAGNALLWAGRLVVVAPFVVSCGAESGGGSDPDATGGVGNATAETGGVVTGGVATGGTSGTATLGGTLTGGVQTGGGGAPPSTGGVPSGTGGVPSTGGVPTGGVPSNTGGVPTGGVPSSTGGAPTGGVPSNTGGVQTGGAPSDTGGVPSNTGGVPTGEDFPFYLGADISTTQGRGMFVDTDGQQKNLFDLLKNHGFNYIRLKTFVDPTAVTWNGCTGSTAGDKDHVIEYGAEAKAEGMGFLLDFHYSDIWADPGNQIIPEAWRGATTPEQLATYMEDYTYDVVSSAIAAGARPDMVQVGNEITPGVLTDVPGSSTDCWGNNPDAAPSNIAGRANTANLITYLNAGIRGVHAADPTIKIVLHTERPSSAASWLGYVVDNGVAVDVFGLSCYEAWQDGAQGCGQAFNALAADSRFDGIEFIVAEYNPGRTEMNLMMRDLPDGRGLGTFFWEPTSGGEWGPSMFSGSTANASDFQEFDAMLPDLGLEPW